VPRFAPAFDRMLRPRWLVPAVVAGTLATLRQVLLTRNETRDAGR